MWLKQLLRIPSDVEVGVAIPIGCVVPLAMGVALVVGAGVLAGSRLGQSSGPDHVVVRVIDDGARGGPAIVSTQVVPLR
jgi:hypothetical protein